MPEPAIPSPAATLVLLRDRPAGGLETLEMINQLSDFIAAAAILIVTALPSASTRLTRRIDARTPA